MGYLIEHMAAEHAAPTSSEWSRMHRWTDGKAYDEDGTSRDSGKQRQNGRVRSSADGRERHLDIALPTMVNLARVMEFRGIEV